MNRNELAMEVERLLDSLVKDMEGWAEKRGKSSDEDGQSNSTWVTEVLLAFKGRAVELREYIWD